MSSFHDHFSAVAESYARYRPTYPDALFDALLKLAPDADLAWDVATGSGQAAVALASRFAHVVASDPSEAQLRDAARHPRVDYRLEPGERSSLAADSVSLICVAQALHWLDFPRFFQEVVRVSKPGAVFAAFSYGLGRVHVTDEARADGLLQHLYNDVLGPYWPSERRFVELGYANVPFPFPRIPVGPFEMDAQWTADEFLGYLGTWSAEKRYREAHGSSAVATIADDVRALWGEPNTKMRVSWPLSVLCGESKARP
jgi:SAM-dependent methyltransferase